MKNYGLYLKSHCELPDFEYEVEAETKGEALAKIRKQTGNSLIEWEDGDLLEIMGELPNEKKIKNQIAVLTAFGFLIFLIYFLLSFMLLKEL